MPYYRININHDDGSTFCCVREHKSSDIEYVQKCFIEQMRQGYKRSIREIEVLMISRLSKEAKAYELSLRRPQFTHSR